MTTDLIATRPANDTITIRRADLAAAAARVAEITGQPYAGVEQSLWAWAEACAALLVQEAAMEVLRPDGWNGAVFRGALALWLQRSGHIDGRAVTEHAADPNGPPF